MIKIKYEENQTYKENPDIGVYAMPTGNFRKRIYFLGIKVYDAETNVDNKCIDIDEPEKKKVGFV